MDLDQLLARPHLSREFRLLAIGKAAIADAQWDRLEDATQRLRRTELERSDLEEMLLQATLFYGFPRVVSAFGIVADAWPSDAPPAGGAIPSSRWPTAGRELFDAIYAKNAEAVHGMLEGFHEDFHAFVIESAYGRILARPALSPKVRELLAIAALAALDQVPQLVAHGRGAKRFGATDDEIEETLVSALSDPALAAEHARRIG